MCVRNKRGRNAYGGGGEVALGSDPTWLMQQELSRVEKIIQPNFRIIRALLREQEDLLGSSITLSLTLCVTLGKSISFSEPPSPH